jgi:hypothetical protein
MSSRTNLFGALVLAAGLAGCVSSDPITGGVPDNGGGSGGGGPANNPYADMTGHIILYDMYGGASALPNSRVATGSATVTFNEDKSSARIDVASNAVNMPSGVLPDKKGSTLSIAGGDDFLIAEYVTPFDTARMSHEFTGYFVGGNRTPVEQIKASATYKGGATGQLVHDRPHGGAYSGGKFEGEYSAGIFTGDTNLNLTVDGGGATVSGAITNLYMHIYQGVDGGTSNANLPGQITLEKTSLSNSAYAGAAKLDIPGATTSAGSYQGGIFGKDGAETAGTFHTRGGVPMAGEGLVGINMVGYFTGKKD